MAWWFEIEQRLKTTGTDGTGASADAAGKYSVYGRYLGIACGLWVETCLHIAAWSSPKAADPREFAWGDDATSVRPLAGQV